MSLNLKNTKTHSGLIAKTLHWTSVAMLLSIIVVASQFEGKLASPEKLKLISLHSSMGLIFLTLMLTRLTWRTINQNPIDSYSIKKWQKLTAISLHRSIYIIIISQCVLGILLLITGGETNRFFDLLEIGPLVEKNSIIHNLALSAHHFFSILIYPLFAIHISAAIYHQVFGLIDEV